MKNYRVMIILFCSLLKSNIYIITIVNPLLNDFIAIKSRIVSNIKQSFDNDFIIVDILINDLTTITQRLDND